MNKLTLPVLILLSLIATVVPVRHAMAVRPFVTDDARVVGDHQIQLETSVRHDKNAFSNLNLVAWGPTANSEITMGFAHGFPLNMESNRGYGLSVPLMQFKYLFWEGKPNGYPGMAAATGALPPWGKGEFRQEKWSEFVFLAFTQSLFEKEAVLIHANIGVSTMNPRTVATWGLGTQIQLMGGLNGVCEVFYNDPYMGKTGGAYQAGFRYIVNDSLQLDATVGGGLFGSEQIPAFVGMGLRIVSDRLY